MIYLFIYLFHESKTYSITMFTVNSLHIWCNLNATFIYSNLPVKFATWIWAVCVNLAIMLCALHKSVLLHNIEGLYMYQQKWRCWIADQGCQFGFFMPESEIMASFEHLRLFLEIKKPDKIRLFLPFFQSKRLISGKTLSELCIRYKYLLTRVYDHAGDKEYCKNFTVALNIIDVIYKKQM